MRAVVAVLAAVRALWRRGALARRALLSASGLLAVAGCLDDSPVTAGSPNVRASLSANVVGAVAGGTVRIRVGYRTSRQALVSLPSTPEQIDVTPGTTVVLPLTVDIGPCLADDERAPRGAPGCHLVIELTLSDAAGGVIDSQTREASGEPVTPGQSVNFGTVTIGVNVSSVVVAPTTLRMSPTEEQRLTASVRDASGAVVTTLPVTWTTSDATVAELSGTTGASITVRGLKVGTASIVATVSGKTSNQVAVSVVPPPPLVIRQPQGAGCVIVGQTLTLEVDSPPGAVSWSSASPGIASIGAATGIVTGVANGQAVITATSGARTGTATVCVTGPLRVLPAPLSIVAGRTAQLSASGVTGGTLSYISSAAPIATVDANGLVRGVSVGQATITVTFTAPSGTDIAPVPVTVGPSAVVITPSSGSAPVSRTTRFTATLQDANGTTLPSVPVTWSISDATIGSLSATSAAAVDVRALKVGSTTIRATLGTVSATAQFTATQPLPASRLEKVSGDGSVCPTRSTGCTFVVRAVDVNGVPVAGTTVIWSSTAECDLPRSAITDDNGLATGTNTCSAVQPGTYTQVATLVTNQQQATFSYSLRGLSIAFVSMDSLSGVRTYAVTSSTGPATGLTLAVDYRSGPAANYVTVLDLSGTSAPATLRVSYYGSELPFGDYTFDVIVSTTTPGIGPGTATVKFTVSPNFFVQPDVRARSRSPWPTSTSRPPND
jgi:uncharacterized protein YjdB